MKTTNNKITTLSDDIQQIGNNTFGEELELIRLCYDHYDPYVLPDNKPVLNITQDEFIGIFDLTSNHQYLSLDQAFRLGAYFKLTLPSLIVLMLKAEWEAFLSGMVGYSKESEMDLGSKLKDKDLIEMYIPHYKPSDGKIFSLVKNIPFSSNNATSFSHVQYYIRELLEDNNFLVGNEHIDQLYTENDITENMMLFESQELQREKYLRLKQLWKFKSGELDELLLHLERKKRINMGIENNYFRKFGVLETDKLSWTYRLEKYKIILVIKQNHPELSYRELYKLAIDKMVEVDKERSELYQKITRSLNYIGDIFNGESLSIVSSEFRNDYMKAIKKLLRKLFFLLHSDTSPGFSELSQNKKIEINKLWLKLMKTTKDEMYAFSPSMLLYSLPDIEQLESIYKRVCEILEINPDDYEIGNYLEFMIKSGKSIDQILEFLKAETEQIELQLAHLELIKNEYTHEVETQIYGAAMANMNEHTEKLKIEIADLKMQTDQLKKQISNEFKVVVK